MAFMFHYLLILSVLVIEVNCEKVLRLLELQSMTGDAWSGGWPCHMAVEMAVDRINQHPGILHGYNLTHEYIDDECVPGKAVYKMVRKITENPPYILIVGPIMSTVGAATAEVTYNWNLTQLAFAASSPVLSDKQRFPKFYRMAAPDGKKNAARIGLMKKFNWQKIATIHYAEEYFSMVIDDFINSVYQNNITIISQQIFLHDPWTQLQALKNVDARIIMTALYEDRAKVLLCTAYRLGLYGPKIVWYFLGYYTLNFWKRDLETVGCTEAEMAEAVEGSFYIGSMVVETEERRGVANLTYSEFWTSFRNHPKYDPSKAIFEEESNWCFDGTWLAALALNCTDARLKEIGHTKSLDEFSYEDGDINEIIFECMGDTKFTGVARGYAFSEDGEIQENIIVDRIQNGELVHVATYRRDINPPSFIWNEGVLKWKDGKVPKDSTTIIELEMVLPSILYITMCVVATLGIVLAVSLFLFNIIFRQNRHVKMSSPNINNVLLVGCVFCYISIYIKSIEVTNGFVCKLRTFFFCMGFTITFGALFSKTWRVYKIFTNKKLIRMSIQDRQLFAINGAMVLVVFLVLVLWEILSPHQVNIRFLENEVYTNDNQDEIHPFVRVCFSQSTSYFNWLIYILEGALLTFGAFLAWETRHVNIAALNDSHQIGLCLYNVVILSAVGLTLSLVLERQDILLYGVTSGCLIIGTTLTQLIVFIPKIYAVYNKVEVRDPSSSNAASNQLSATKLSSEPNEATSTAT